MENTMWLVITALISGLLATIVTIAWQNHAEVRKRKMDVFETLMSYRYMISSEESVKALNSLDVVFYNDKAVRGAYADFLNEADKKPEFNPNIGDKHLKLLEEMSKSLKLGEIHWDDIKHTYYPTGLSEKIQEETVLRKMQIQSAAAAVESTQTQQNTPSNDQFTQQIMAQVLPDLLKNPESLKNLMELGERFGVKKS